MGELSAQGPNGTRQVALVTGSTDGLGRELALRIAGMGMHVIVHGRSQERGEGVVQEILDGGGSARFIRADLASLNEVRSLASTVLTEYDRLDLLVNNAGIGRGADETLREESMDGHELRFAVNCLSHFPLTRTLLPLLVETGPGRVVSITSTAQQAIDFDDVMEVAPNAVHPAVFMATTMVLSRGGTPMATIDEGADPVMQVITHPDAGTGQYYNQARPAQANAQAYDVEARRRLHALAMELTGWN